MEGVSFVRKESLSILCLKYCLTLSIGLTDIGRIKLKMEELFI